MFEDFFGRGPQRPHTTSHRGQDIEQPVEIHFEDAIHGTTTEVRVTRRDGSAERLRVKIPPGVDTNSKVRIAGKGEAGISGGPAGDLYIVTRVQPPCVFCPAR
jgi:DnaJ-class molecular chaperone